MVVPIHHFKVRALPPSPVPNAFYWLLRDNGEVDGYLTDINGVPKLIEGDTANATLEPVSAVAALDLIKGSPVTIDRATGKFVAADADNKLTSFVAGLLIADVVSGFVGNAAADRLTLADWTPIVGTVTLSPGVNYFLNSGGGLSTVPGGACIAMVGKALDTVTLLIDIQSPIQL
jgi:hypothetical protein